MRVFIISLCLLLTGCETFTKKEVVVKTEYIVRSASNAQKELPPHPTPINIQSATQLELAQWIVETEKRMLDLESIIKRLIEFYEKPEEKKPVKEEDK